MFNSSISLNRIYTLKRTDPHKALSLAAEMHDNDTMNIIQKFIPVHNEHATSFLNDEVKALSTKINEINLDDHKDDLLGHHHQEFDA